MRVLRVKMKNFRQYKDQEIYLPGDGMIGIVGKNGAGKSTLFNAIGWCYYGKIKNVTNNMIKNQAAGKKDTCFVEVDFLFQGKHHRVHRDLVSSRCFAEVEGVTVALGTSNLNLYIEETLFKMDYKAFSVCYYAQQDEFDALAKAKPAERAQIISRLLRIEAIDKAAEETRKDYRDLEKEVHESKRFLKDFVQLDLVKTQLENEVKSLLRQIKEKQTLITKNEEGLKDLLFEKSKGDKAFETFRELKATRQNLAIRIETIQDSSIKPNRERLEKLLQDKEVFRQIQYAIAEYPILNEKREELASHRLQYQEKTNVEKEMDKIKQDVARYKKEYDSISVQLDGFEEPTEAIAAKEKEQLSLQEAMTTLRDEYNELNFLKKSKKEKVNELNETKKKFDELGSDAPCPTCERPLGEHYEDKMVHIDTEIASVENAIVEAEKAMQKIQDEAKTTKSTHQEVAQAIKDLRVKEMEQGTLKERKSNMEKELHIRKKQFRTLNERFEEIKEVVFDENVYSALLSKIKEMKPVYEKAIGIQTSLQEIGEIEKTIAEKEAAVLSYEKEMAQINQDLASLAFDEVAFGELTEKIERAQQQIQQGLQEKATMESEVRVAETKIQNVVDVIEENRAILAQIKVKEEEMALLSKLDQVYKAYKKDKLTKIAPALGSIISDLMDLITNGKYDMVELDEEYNIFIYRNNVKNPLSFYSGGEQKLAALCQRLAVSKILSKQTGQATFDMLSMDEVFGSMDNERQDKLIETLRNLNQLFPQILCVSHSDNVKSMFDYILEIEIDTNGFSKASWATTWDASSIVERIDQYDITSMTNEEEFDEETV